ncbi:hypothetical protein N7462_009578 [Penicillium macrosclerotiorum]|uniref:uncharacterized protein n=1 Tax=Penicillium macrosclerotiorum TaxID=303699 RepID=UPI0025476D31|nr:uncharacterized protein N7462_009578 [Penicillium macrosclerotiorum]KAJ5674139.1 hypothetical protein N7462_009578 [Penicillium macrosclerotiorum]
MELNGTHNYIGWVKEWSACGVISNFILTSVNSHRHRHARLKSGAIITIINTIFIVKFIGMSSHRCLSILFLRLLVLCVASVINAADAGEVFPPHADRNGRYCLFPEEIARFARMFQRLFTHDS